MNAGEGDTRPVEPKEPGAKVSPGKGGRGGAE